MRIGSTVKPMQKDEREALFNKRLRNSIGKIPAPRDGLTFAQLKIYYEEMGLALNEFFMQNLELLTPDGKPNYAAYLLADENGVSLQVAKYGGKDRVNLIENKNYGRCSLVKAAKNILERLNIENTVYTKITRINRIEKPILNINIKNYVFTICFAHIQKIRFIYIYIIFIPDPDCMFYSICSISDITCGKMRKYRRFRVLGGTKNQ